MILCCRCFPFEENCYPKTLIFFRCPSFVTWLTNFQSDIITPKDFFVCFLLYTILGNGVPMVTKLVLEKHAVCNKNGISFVKGCGMGPWLVLVSPCFRKNVVATCKIGSFLCSLDNLLQKNAIVLFFGNQMSKWRSLRKRLFLTYFSHFLFTREKLQKFLQHISQTHTYAYFAHLLTFFALPILKKIQIYQVRFLFGMSPGVDSYSRHFGTINK